MPSHDVQMLQTAASIENVAVATYGVALTLDLVGGTSANPVLRAFVQKTMSQHQNHAGAFNAALERLGAERQAKPDPVLLDMVDKAKPGLTGPGPVLALAIELEKGAAETYVASTGAASDASVRSLFARIMGVEAQHLAVLLAVQALVTAGTPELLAVPPDATALPEAAGPVGFPDTFFRTEAARPAAEGALR